MDNDKVAEINKEVEKAWVLSLSDTEAAKERYGGILEQCKSVSYDKGRGRCLMGIGRILCIQLNIVDSMEMLEEALTILSDCMDDLGVCYCYTYIGLNYLYLPIPNYDAALEFLERAYSFAEKTQNVEAIQRVLGNTGEIYRKWSHFEEALEKFQQCLSFSEKEQLQQGIAFAHGNIASVLNSLHRYEEAISYFKKSIAAFEQLGHSFMVIGFLREMAESFIGLKRFDEARETLELALKQGIPLNERFQTHTVYMLLAKIESEAGNYDAAEKMLMCSLENSEIIKSDKLKYRSMLGLSELAEQRGDLHTALKYYKQYHETFLELNRSELQERIRFRDFELQLEKKKQEAELANQSLKQFETISQIGQRITATLNAEQIVRAVYDSIGTLMEVKQFAFGLCDDPARPIDFKELPDTREYAFFQKRHLSWLSSILEWCLTNRMPIVIQDVENHSTQYRAHVSESGEAEELKGSLLCSPVVGAEKLLGVLVVHSERKNAYTPLNLEALKALSAYSAIAILNSKHVDEIKDTNIQLERIASTDSLTGLFNRASFTKNMVNEIQRVKRYAGNISTGFSVAFIDIDNFKYYNDTFGHGIGDRILVAASRIISSDLRAVDSIARFGGDEFILLLPETPAEQCLHVTGRIQEMLLQQNGFTDTVADFLGHAITIPREHWLTCTIGICELKPEDISTLRPEDIMLRADLALASAKSMGKGSCVVWSPGLKRS